MALQRTTDTPLPGEAAWQVGGRGGCAEARAWARVERPPAQILVVVAITHVRDVWAEEEKGFTRTVIGCESADPKPPASAAGGGRAGRAAGACLRAGLAPLAVKGKQGKIPARRGSFEMATCRSPLTARPRAGRDVFSV